MRTKIIQYDHQKFGQMLREKRIKANLGQREVSKLIGLSSPQYISNIERGVVLPSSRVWNVLARIYKINKLLIEEVRPSSSMDRSERSVGRTKGPRRNTRMSTHK